MDSRHDERPDDLKNVDQGANGGSLGKQTRTMKWDVGVCIDYGQNMCFFVGQGKQVVVLLCPTYESEIRPREYSEGFLLEYVKETAKVAQVYPPVVVAMPGIYRDWNSFCHTRSPVFQTGISGCSKRSSHSCAT